MVTELYKSGEEWRQDGDPELVTRRLYCEIHEREENHNFKVGDIVMFLDQEDCMIDFNKGEVISRSNTHISVKILYSGPGTHPPYPFPVHLRSFYTAGNCKRPYTEMWRVLPFNEENFTELETQIIQLNRERRIYHKKAKEFEEYLRQKHDVMFKAELADLLAGIPKNDRDLARCLEELGFHP